MNNEYTTSGYDYGQGPRNQPPRPAPPKPKCDTGVCKDGGSAPFYTLYEKDSGGWRTGRSMVICHTCYYGGVKPQFRGDLTVMPIQPPVVESKIAENVELKQLQQKDASQLLLQQATTQSSYSGQHMKTIIEYPAPATEEVASGHDAMRVEEVETQLIDSPTPASLLTHDINGLSPYSSESDVMKGTSEPESPDNQDNEEKHSTHAEKKPAPRRHKKE